MTDELTFRELIQEINNHMTYLLSKWYVFLIGSLIAGGASAYLISQYDVLYYAPLTFTLNDSDSSNKSAGFILGQLGLGAGGSGTNALKLLELSRSRQIVIPALFDSTIVNGRADILANHLIYHYQFHDKWEESTELNGFLFKGIIPGEDDLVVNRALKQVHQFVVGSAEKRGLAKLSYDEVTEIFTIDARAVRPEIAYALVNGLFRSLEEFHVRASTKKQAETYERLNFKSDSILTLLNVVESRLAAERDRNAGVPLFRNSVSIQRLNRELLILNTMYSEVIKNKETAAFFLATERPAFVVIDGPLKPLRKITNSIVKNTILGVLAAVFLIGLFLFFRKLFKDALSDPINKIGND